MMLGDWIKEVEAICQPLSTHIVTGSDDEARMIEERLVQSNTFIPLKKRPNSFLARSSPDDVARVEDRTFICTTDPTDAGPTNNWQHPDEMKKTLKGLFTGCMRGRIMYVVPFCMGPIDSPHAKIGVQITDSAYVVANMRLMTHMGQEALDRLPEHFVRCLHSVGVSNDTAWPCDPKNIYISHFPETLEVWSYGSGYGGNALLNKKCFALRLASKMALQEGWLAEHMLIVGVTNPEGLKRYFAASFPSACGKTNLAMLTSSLPGWKVECVGDDIAWMHWGGDGRLYAINPESGFFGVAPGTSMGSNPNAMKSIEKNTIFTNVALTDDGDVWWEGMTKTPPEHAIGWLGKDWTPGSDQKAAHPNSRFTVSIQQCPILDPSWNSPQGVPISGIIFGGRRSHTVPLVRQALNWSHGVFLAASMTSEMTAAAKGVVGRVRHDPFAMLPFCGYNMGDYFSHWLSMYQPDRIMPEIFYVNWFQKDADGKFLWPGFGDNIRIIKWMFEAIEKTAKRKRTPIGFMPHPESIDLSNLTVAPDAMKRLLEVDPEMWRAEAKELSAYFELFGDRLPVAIKTETGNLLQAFTS